MKIYLNGQQSLTNRGCEAIVRGTIAILQMWGVDATVYVPSKTPEEDLAVLEFDPLSNSMLVPALRRRHIPAAYPPLGWISGRLDTRIGQFLLSPVGASRSILRPWREADAFLSVGGDLYTEDYSLPAVVLSQDRFATMSGKPSLLWGASVGPFVKGSTISRLAAPILRKMPLIIVRENRSFEIISQLCPDVPVMRLPDPAFLLPYTPERRNPGQIGLNLSPLSERFVGNVSDYRDEVIAFVRGLLSRAPRVLLIPHVFGENPGDWNRDDNYLMELADEVGEAPNLQAVAGRPSAAVLKSIISSCDLFIGARMHSTIAAVSSSTPTLSLAYSSKAYGLNENLFGSLEYLVDVNDFRAAPTLDIVDGMLQSLEAIRSQLKDLHANQVDAWKGAKSAVLEAIR